MFPTWADWDITYTRKGLLKKATSRALKTFALAALMFGIVQQRRNGLRAGISAHLKSLIRGLLFRGAGLLQVAGSKV